MRIMIEDRLGAARLFSAAAGVLTAIAAAGGLWLSGLYQEPDSLVALFRGYDLVSLVVAVPVLAVVLLPALRRSVRAQLVWLGVLGYLLYAYATYLFGAGFNDFFLLHVAIFVLALFAFGLGLARLDVAALGTRPGGRARWVAGFLVLLALALGGVWLFFSLRYAVTGQPPSPMLVVQPDAGLHLGYALDLALLVPGYVYAAVLLWRRRPWGYVWGGLLLVAGLLHQVAYLTILFLQAETGVPGATRYDFADLPIALGYLVATVVLLTGVASRGARPVVPRPRAPEVAADRRHGRLGV